MTRKTLSIIVGLLLIGGIAVAQVVSIVPNGGSGGGSTTAPFYDAGALSIGGQPTTSIKIIRTAANNATDCSGSAGMVPCSGPPSQIVMPVAGTITEFTSICESGAGTGTGTQQFAVYDVMTGAFICDTTYACTTGIVDAGYTWGVDGGCTFAAGDQLQFWAGALTGTCTGYPNFRWTVWGNY